MHKLCNPVLKQFLEKYTKQNIPNKSTLRKNYIPNFYKNVIEKIINDIGDSYVYLIVDKTTDPRGFCKIFLYFFIINLRKKLQKNVCKIII